MEEMWKLCKFQCPKVPVVRKCCFCVPVRKGVIIFGYINLVFSLLAFPLLIFLLVEHLTTGKAVDDENGRLDPLIHLPLTLVLLAIDVSMTIVLLVGAHKRKQLLLKIFFYFESAFQLLTLCMDLVYFDYHEDLENTVYFIFLVLYVFLLYLVYCTINVIEESSEVQYVAHRDQNNTS